jgi:glycosyltransferase involved in cell wall biosynthesis
MDTDPRGVLFVGNFESDVGWAWPFIEDLWLEIARHPALEDHVFHVIYWVVREISPRLRSAGWEITERSFPGDLADLRTFLRARRIRVVYLSDRAFCSPVYALCRAAGVETIIVHDHSPGLQEEPGPVRGALKSAVCRLPWVPCDAAFGVGPFVVDRIRRVNRLPRARIHRVTNGIDPGPEPPARPPSDTVRLITAARADVYKGIDFAVDVMAEVVLNRGLDEVRYEFCGEGPDLEAFRERAGARGVDHVIEFPGLVADVPARLARADVALHPSKGEALSLAILEYMRAGLPVIVPDNRSVNSPLRDGVDAVFYREGDVASAADAVEALVRDRDRRLALGRQARRSQVENFSRENMLDELRRALSATLG